MNLHWLITVIRSPQFTLCPWVWANVYWHISMILVSCRVFSLPEKSLVLHQIHSSHLPHLESTDLFTSSIVLAFPEHRIIGITYSVTFSDWYFSLWSSKMAAHFVLPLAMNENYYFSTFLPGFGAVGVLDLSPYNRWIGYLTDTLICISIMTMLGSILA